MQHMSLMKSPILKFVDFTKTQKSRYLENETLFFLQIKKFINYTSRTTLWHKILFVAEVIFNLVLLTFLKCSTLNVLNDLALRKCTSISRYISFSKKIICQRMAFEAQTD